MQRFLTLAFFLLVLGAASPVWAQYCAPGFTTGCSIGDLCNGVQFNTISNLNSGCGGPFVVPGNSYWSYYSNLNTNVVMGQSYTLTVYTGSDYGQQFGVWIDWNKDNDFADAGEYVFNTTTSVPTNSSTTANITIPFTAVPGTTRMRVRCNWATALTAGQSCASTAYGEVEDYNITIVSPSPNDCGVTEVITPSDGCNAGSAEVVSVRLYNFGTAPQSNIPVSFRVDGGPVMTEVYTGTLAPGGTNVVFTFQSNFANISAMGNHTVRAWASLPGDGFAINDSSALKNVFNYPVVGTFPHLQDFEASTGGWNSVGGAFSWQTPNGAPITTAYSGTKTWTTADPQFPTNNVSYVYSPCYDLSTMQNPVLSLAVNWSSPTNSGAVLQYSTDNGVTWIRVGNATQGINWYNQTNISSQPGGQSQGWSGTGSQSSGGWKVGGSQIGGLAGLPNARFRMAFASGGSIGNGIAFDDFRIYEGPVANLGPDQQVCAGDTVNLNVGLGFSSYLWSTTDTTSSISVYTSNYYIVVVEDAVGFTDRDTIQITISDPDVSLGADLTGCEGDSLALSFTSNTPNITWEWFNGNTTATQLMVTGSGVQNYAITAIDSNGCTVNDTVRVTYNELPDVDLGGATQTLCAGQNTLLNASANVPNSIYFWSNGSNTQQILVSTPGLYWVQVATPQGCVGADSTIVDVLPTPTVNLGADENICSNINVTLNAGNPGATYLWNNGDQTQTLNVTQVGQYSVQVTNNLGCSGYDTINIGQSQLVNISLPPTAQGCGQASLDATSNGAASYLWSNGVTTPSQVIQASGTYQVQVTDAQGCFDIASIVVTIGQPINAYFWAPDTVVVGTPVQFVDGTAPLSNDWQWDFGNGDNTSGTGNPIYTYNATGDYTVSLTTNSAGGCSDVFTRTVVVVEATVGATDATALAANATVYPNPSNGLFNVNALFAQPTAGTLRVVDMQGRTVVLRDFTSTSELTTELDLREFGASIYQLMLETPQGRISTKLVVL